MFTRRFAQLLLLVLIIPSVSACSAMAMHHLGHNVSHKTTVSSDPITGEWDVVFKVDASTTPATFNLRLDGDKVTGTANSQHTGPGVLRDGFWKDGQLKFTVDFEKHESIAITGALKDGALAGEFRTEGFVSNWEAKRKGAAASSSAASAPATAPKPGDPISGEWDAEFAVGEQKVQSVLKLKLEGTKITGTSESKTAGSGDLTEGTFSHDGVAFTMPGPHGPVKITGVLKEGKLAGDFLMGQIRGTWTATRK